MCSKCLWSSDPSLRPMGWERTRERKREWKRKREKKKISCWARKRAASECSIARKNYELDFVAKRMFFDHLACFSLFCRHQQWQQKNEHDDELPLKWDWRTSFLSLFPFGEKKKKLDRGLIDRHFIPESCFSSSIPRGYYEEINNVAHMFLKSCFIFYRYDQCFRAWRLPCRIANTCGPRFKGTSPFFLLFHPNRISNKRVKREEEGREKKGRSPLNFNVSRSGHKRNFLKVGERILSSRV